MSWVRAPPGTQLFLLNETPVSFPWRFHLAVRIPASHAGYTGSSPVGATNNESQVADLLQLGISLFIYAARFAPLNHNNALKMPT